MKAKSKEPKAEKKTDVGSPFHHLKLLTTEKREFTEEERKAYNPRMMNRIISMAEPFIPIANMLNGCLFKGMGADQHRAVLSAILPKRYIPFKYIKKGQQERREGLLRAAMLYYGTGSRDAEEILGTLTPEQEAVLMDFLEVAGE